TERQQLLRQLRVRPEIREQGKIVARMQERQDRVGVRSLKRFARGGRQRDRDVARERAVRRAGRQSSRRVVLIEQRLRCVFRLLHVRLIERVDAEEPSGDGGGDFPAQE